MEVAALLPRARVLSLDASASTYDYERLTSDAVLEYLDEGAQGESVGLPRGGLSRREHEVLAHIAAGRTDALVRDLDGGACGVDGRWLHGDAMIPTEAIRRR